MTSKYFEIRDPLDANLNALLQDIARRYLVGKQVTAMQPKNADPATVGISVTHANLDFLIKHGLHMLSSGSPLLADLAMPLKQQLLASVSLGVAASQTQTATLTTVLTAFAEGELPTPIIFKGSALGVLEYPHAWQRPKSDHDLLIPANAKTQYHQNLLAQGFVLMPNNSGQWVSYQSSYVRKISESSHLWIDLHWKISNRQMLATLFGYADLAPRARRLSIASLNNGQILDASSSEQCVALVPTRADCIVLAAQHVIGHHSQDTRLLWFFDLLMLVDRCSEQDMDELVSLCAELKVAAIVLAGIDYAESVFVPVAPPSLRQQLAKLAQRPEPTQVLIEHKHTRARLVYWDLRAIDSWRGKWQFIVENFLPDREYMQVRFKSRWVVVSHLKRWFGFSDSSL